MVHYLKINSLSETGKSLSDFLSRCEQAEEQARQYVKSLGAETYYESPEGMAGGVAAIELPLDAPVPDGWEVMDDQSHIQQVDPSRQVCIPKEDIKELTIVSEMELISILSLKPLVRKGMRLPMTFGRHTPSVFYVRGFFYVTSPYESSSGDVRLISEKEYNRKKFLAMKRQHNENS